jgi:regulatory protein
LDKIRDIALKHLQYRERSTKEVVDHLKSKGYQEEDIEETIGFLKEFGYINDERYGEIYINYGIAKGWGPIKLKHGLKEKGISPELMEAIFENHEIYEREKDLAMGQAMKILDRMGMESNSKQELNEKHLAKIGRRLAALGYRTHTVYGVLGELKNN